MTEEGRRFVIQHHDREPDPHFDIMLERGDSLRTWSTPRPPGEGESEARALPDHRTIYLEYEGEISGGRGRVRIWDRGEYRTEAWDDDRVSVILAGERLQGGLSLTRIGGDRWTLEFEPAAPP